MTKQEQEAITAKHFEQLIEIAEKHNIKKFCLNSLMVEFNETEQKGEAE